MYKSCLFCSGCDEAAERFYEEQFIRGYKRPLGVVWKMPDCEVFEEDSEDRVEGVYGVWFEVY